MNTQSQCNTGWQQHHGWGHHHHHPGRHFASFKMLLGILVVAAIFKSGLWLPILGLGLLAFAFTQMNGGMGGWQQRWHSEYGDEKRKRGFGPMSGPWVGQTEPDGEKAKRGERDDGYV